MITALPFLLAAAAIQGGDATPASSGTRATIHASATIVAAKRVSFADIKQAGAHDRATDRQVTKAADNGKQNISLVEFH